MSGQDASRTYNVTPPGQTFKLRSSGNRLYGSASNNETNQNTSWQAGFIVKGTGDTTWTWTGSGCGSTLGLMYSKGGALRIHKKSSDPALTRSNDDYSLSGATFALYSDSACTKKVYPAGSAVLATNEQSNIWAVSPATEGFVGTPTDIPAGTYYLKELTAPKGFSKINGEGRYGQITITASRYTDISVYDNPLRPKATYRSDKYGKVKDIKTDTMVQETSETVQLKKSPGGLDAPEEEPADGYHTVDPEAPWTADKAVTLKNGTVLAKGTPMTMEQIKNVVMTEDVVFSVLHSINENYQGPVKEYSGGKKKTSGEKYTYTITQKLNLHASNYPNKNYQSFEMTDTLPDELEYLSSAVYDKETGESLNSTYFIVTAAGQDITATAFKA